jgi:hypothetical protein
MLKFAGVLALFGLSFLACSREPDRVVDTPAGGAPVTLGTQHRNVVINGVMIDADTLMAIETRYRVRIADARFWYDDESGLFGSEGRQPTGFFVAGLHLGGPLRADASNGSSGIFVNGRDLTDVEVAFLAQYIPVYEGRYWLDAAGDVGYEGSSDVLFNLFSVVRGARSSGGGSGGDNFYGSSLIDSASNSQGGCSYISVDGTTYTSGCG